MKKTRFSEEQMVKILREADKAPVAEVPKKHGVSDVTIYAWRKRFGQLEAVDVKRLRQLEHENGRVIVIARYHGTHRKSGAKLYCQAVHSWWVDGGKIVRFQQYADTAQLSRLS